MEKNEEKFKKKKTPKYEAFMMMYRRGRDLLKCEDLEGWLEEGHFVAHYIEVIEHFNEALLHVKAPNEECTRKRKALLERMHLFWRKDLWLIQNEEEGLYEKWRREEGVLEEIRQDENEGNLGKNYSC